MRILIATAVEIERKAVLVGLQNIRDTDVIAVGVGPIAAAVNTTMKLATTSYNLILSLGIAGGFQNQVEIGSLIVAEEVFCADLGAETGCGGFQSLDELGFGSSNIKIDSTLVRTVAHALTQAGLPIQTGPILTVSTATGTMETAMKRSTRIPNGVAEAMEGFGVASAAHAYGIPFIEIRSISNEVGTRDKANWRMNEALAMLTKASRILEKEVFDENRFFALSK